MLNFSNLTRQSQEKLHLALDLLERNRRLNFEGLWGSSAPLISVFIHNLTKKPVLYITPHIDQADLIQEDIELFAGRVDTIVFPSWEGDRPKVIMGDEISAERLYCINRLIRSGTCPAFIIAPIQSIMFPVPRPEILKEHCIRFRVNDTLSIEKLGEWLVEHKYNRIDQVEQPGDFAIRGGIVDIYPSGEGYPIRIELFGEQIESIREFDPISQRSTESLMEFTLSALPEFFEDGSSCNFLEYIPENTVIFWAEPVDIAEVANIFVTRLNDPIGVFPYNVIREKAGSFAQVDLSRFATEFAKVKIRFNTEPLPRFSADAKESISQLVELSKSLKKIYLICENQAEIERTTNLLLQKDNRLGDKISLLEGVISKGFMWKDEEIGIIGNYELFNRYEYRYRLRRRAVVKTTDVFFELERGDYVVHIDHGIGKFEGLKLIKRDGKKEEVAAIKYAENSILYVPVSQLNLVQKYVGGFRGHPPLSKLGGKSWERTKEKVRSAVTSLASELLEIQAKREVLGGIGFAPDNEWQRQLEESFIYQETEDQMIALRDMKADMESTKPMDRLLCGDVGYGKTELAVRAAFKAVNSGYQVAVLVPTTLLAEQHYRTFRERLAEFPVEIEFLSRFKKKTEQEEIIRKLEDGAIDIIIGTHRLVSEDVRFANLGLLIIDEEQRFGVVHKEKLKKVRAIVDVLTMTATPIPRTLHMSLIGIRDISTLATPPLDRRAVQTMVYKFDWKIIREGILRELNRNGQVFFVHNRIYNIDKLTHKLQQHVPEARIAYAHGRMKSSELEGVILKFLDREIDVLVCTTIIESGIDIPTVNTIFINNADRFGLAELHQLRGRVGRYKYKAYAYLLIPDDRSITPTAARRLRAIEEYSELGAGFRIALRDLEIRGAGNILGKEQSGHISAVGYELYCKLLESAVHKLKTGEEKVPEVMKTNIELEIEKYIPTTYISSERQRLQVYRKLASVSTILECEALKEELTDIFGPLPEKVRRLIELEKLRILGGKFQIRRIRFYGGELIFYLTDPKACSGVFTCIPFEPRFADPREVHIRLPARLHKPSAIINLLFEMFNEKWKEK